MAEITKDHDITGRLLVVEDDHLIREMLREICEQEGHEVVAVADGREALQIAQNESFDLMLSDIHLPGMNGLDLLVRVKEIHPTISVIVLTGHPAIEKAIDAMKRGAADFITKPFSVDQMNHVIRKNLGEQRLIAENRRLLAELNNKAVIETLNRQLHTKVNQLTKLYRISESFHSYVDNDSLLQYVVDLACELTGAQRVSLLTYDRKQRFLVLRASKGLPDEVKRGDVRVPVGSSIAGTVAKSLKPVRTSAADGLADETSERDHRSYASNSWLSVPLFIGGDLFGVLNLTDKADRSDFNEEDEHLAMVLAEKGGAKLENNVLYEGIYSNLLDTLRALVSTIEAKDSYTRHHSQRVTEIALAIARHIGVSEEECESIAFAGTLHDIGKIGIRDNILLKTSRLTREEYEIMKQHPSIGVSIVEPLGLLEIERNIIRHHHERFDGYGYPAGLKDGQVDMLTWIVSIADAFDAMSSTRAYRRALGLPVVISELRKNSGTQFHPDLVRALLELLDLGKVHPSEPVETTHPPMGEPHRGDVPLRRATAT